MKKEFNPMRVIRLSSPERFAALAASAGGDFEAAQADPAAFWASGDAATRRVLGALLREASDMATGDAIAVAMQEAGDDAPAVAATLAGKGGGSNHDRAITLMLDYPDLARVSRQFAHADREAESRYWVARNGMPDRPADVTPAALAELGRSVAGFYQARQGRGEYHHVEHLRRADGQDYVFLTLADFADHREDFDDAGRLARFPVNPAFEVIFAHDAGLRSLSTCARGGKKIIEPLQEIFAAAILHGQPAPEDARRYPYRLNDLLRREFDFATDPEDGVQAVQLREIQFAVIGNEAERIRLSAPRAPVTVHDMFEQYIDQKRLPVSQLLVQRTRMSFLFVPGGLCRSLTFDLTPKSSTLKSKPEDQRMLAEKYLRRWNIEVA